MPRKGTTPTATARQRLRAAAARAHPWTPSPPRDPTDFCREFFGGRDPLSFDPFGDPHADILRGQEAPADAEGEAEKATRLFSTFGGSPAFGVGSPSFDTRLVSCGSVRDGGLSSVSTSRGSGGRCNFKSVSTSTKIINGKKITANRTVENGQERMKAEEGGDLKSLPVNGREQLSRPDTNSRPPVTESTRRRSRALF